MLSMFFQNKIAAIATTSLLRCGLFYRWGEDVHKGYKKAANGQVESGSYGTYRWAQEVGFSSQEAQVIADACQAVDDEVATAPANPWGGQDWHFDYHDSWDTWATVKDSRIGLADKQLHKSIIIGSLHELGHGLHPLQDMFSHTPDFTRKTWGKFVLHDLITDKITTEPQARITYTERATKAYLQSYMGGRKGISTWENGLNSFLDEARKEAKKEVGVSVLKQTYTLWESVSSSAASVKNKIVGLFARDTDKVVNSEDYEKRRLSTIAPS